MVRPEELPWTLPGCRGLGTDRMNRPSAACRPGDLVQPAADGGITLNVTKDVAIWHSSSAPNFGWIVTCDSWARFSSPFSHGPSIWKLRVTYEPE